MFQCIGIDARNEITCHERSNVARGAHRIGTHARGRHSVRAREQQAEENQDPRLFLATIARLVHVPLVQAPPIADVIDR